jgi:hypothetical protein
MAHDVGADSMALKRNEFDEDFFVFLTTLRDLEILARAVEMQITNAQSVMRRAMEDSRKQQPQAGPKKASIGLSTLLSIPNIFEAEPSRISFGSASREDEEMLRLVDELNGRAQAQGLCMVYEATERFLKQFAIRLYFAKRNEWELKYRKDFHARNPQYAKDGFRNTDTYLEKYVDHVAKHNCDKLLKELRLMLPEFNLICENNWFANLYEVYRAIAFIRHTTVHRAREPEPTELMQSSTWVRGTVEALTEKSVATGRDTILPWVNRSYTLYEGAAAFAYALYRVVSQQLKRKVAIQ